MRAGVVALLLATSAACNHWRPYYGLVGPPVAPPVLAADDVLSRMLLIGDAGEPAVAGEPVLTVLSDTAAHLPGRTTIVFLGDNVYPAGLTPQTLNQPTTIRKLQAQIDAVAPGAEGIFIPGNHDWANAREAGLQAIQNQSDYLARSGANVRMVPRAGCPGPASVDLGGLELIALDTQWWLHRHAKLTDECPSGPDTAAVTRSIEALMTGTGVHRVMVAHHPLETAGSHGGFFPWSNYMFPLTAIDGGGLWQWFPAQIVLGAAIGNWSAPAGVVVGVVGSIAHQVARWFGVTRQDMASKHYDHMADQITAAASVNPPLVYAAGHDHGLQVLCGRPGEPIYQLVSGLGSAVKATPVGHTPRTLFAHSAPGFMAVDLLSDGSVLLRVIETAPRGVVYWRWLAREGVPVECEPGSGPFTDTG